MDRQGEQGKTLLNATLFLRWLFIALHLQNKHITLASTVRRLIFMCNKDRGGMDVKSLSPYESAKRELVMTILYMAVITFQAIYVAPKSPSVAIVIFIIFQSIGVLMLRHYIKKVKELKEDQST